MYIDFHHYIKCFYHIVSSDFFANIVSFLAFLIAIIIGSRKVSEILFEFNIRKCNAVFSYHANLKIYIRRLTRIISDDQGEPTHTLYLLSPNSELRDCGCGYEPHAKSLSILSEKFLDYLSAKSEQIPVANSKYEDDEWTISMEKLVNFLLDFCLYGSESYLPNLNTKDKIEKYHNDLTILLNRITELLNGMRSEFWKKCNIKK
ncbi:MAG: hypothetical protein FWC26_13575 [Fibromonadales bacterium]|nr:hypothetical protein [Fibromonadales bacterium]